MNEEGILEDRVNNREFDVNDFSYSTTKLLVLIPIASNPGVPKPQPSPNDLMIHCTCASLPEDAGVSWNTQHLPLLTPSTPLQRLRQRLTMQLRKTANPWPVSIIWRHILQKDYNDSKVDSKKCSKCKIVGTSNLGAMWSVVKDRVRTSSGKFTKFGLVCKYNVYPWDFLTDRKAR